MGESGLMQFQEILSRFDQKGEGGGIEKMKNGGESDADLMHLSLE
jgi:hypothetical protein